jgi:hypothetical protein
MEKESILINQIKDLFTYRNAFKKACKHIARHTKYEIRCPALFDCFSYKAYMPCVDGNNKANHKHCKKKNELNFVSCCWQMYFKHLSKGIGNG